MKRAKLPDGGALSIDEREKGEEDKLAGMLSLRGLLEHRIDDLASEMDAVTQYLSVDGPGGAAFRSEPVAEG